MAGTRRNYGHKEELCTESEARKEKEGSQYVRKEDVRFSAETEGR